MSLFLRPLHPSGMTVATVLCALLLCGCGTYHSISMKARQEIVSGDLPAARTLLEEDAGKDPDVLNQLERGVLLFYEGKYAESNQLLQSADLKIEDLYTKSLTAEALAFLSNDATLPYTGYPHERVLLHIYGALNYLALGDEENALVQCRRVADRLKQMDSVRAEKKGYTDDPFAQWLSAILFAQDGDANATMVAARRAQAAFDEMESIWGHPKPAGLIADHIAWARRFGFTEEARELTEATGLSARAPLRSGEGEILLIYESGFVSHLVEEKLSFPILKSDEDGDYENDMAFAHAVYLRGHRGALLIDHDKVKIDYWVKTAFPVMVDTPAQLRTARLVVDDQAVPTQLVEDVSALARLTFDESTANRAIRTIVRAIAKYAAVNAVEKDDKPLRWLANAAVALSERADTRSWSLLPDRIHLARLRLPAGTYPVTVEVLDDRGQVAQTATFEAVRVVSGEITMLHHRSYQ